MRKTAMRHGRREGGIGRLLRLGIGIEFQFSQRFQLVSNYSVHNMLKQAVRHRAAVYGFRLYPPYLSGFQPVDPPSLCHYTTAIPENVRR
jgi:hypothetical protein